MTPQEITSEDVAAWMQTQLAKALQQDHYASISVEIRAFRTSPKAEAYFRIFHSENYQSHELPTIEECFEQIANITPKTTAAKKRAEAARLMEEADKLEQEGNI